ncbi:Mediator of DNA damage checkpoint protein 1 [Terramyces sp. JEL0728]|nr:Mediator of DNA damage checkpoint protein 1 [Terramyces sp. JEL0728]
MDDNRIAYINQRGKMRIEEQDIRLIAELHELDFNKIHKIYNGTNIIGSAPKVDIQLDGVGVSSYHAIIEISPDGSEHFIEDLSSTNGTFLGTAEYRLSSRRMYQLLDHKIITFGPTKCQYKMLKDCWNDLTESSTEEPAVPGIDYPQMPLESIHTNKQEPEQNCFNVVESMEIDGDIGLDLDSTENRKINADDSINTSKDSQIKADSKSTNPKMNQDEIISNELREKENNPPAVEKEKGQETAKKAKKQTAKKQRMHTAKVEELEVAIDDMLSNETLAKPASTRKKRSSLTSRYSDDSQSTKKPRNSLDRKETPRVLLGKIITLEECRETLEYLNGEEAQDYQNCTHFVMDIMRRTVKFLCCLSYGKYIVTSKWLEASKKAGYFVGKHRLI